MSEQQPRPQVVNDRCERPGAPSAGGSATSQPERRIGSTDPLDATWDVIAFDLGLKPVVKLEQDSAQLDELTVVLSQRWPGVCFRMRKAPDARATSVELFVGRDPHEVEEAVQLTERIEREKQPDRLRAAMLRLGELLAYPACCTRAFADEPLSLRGNNERLRVLRRLQAGPRVAPEANPLLTSYVPCSLWCEASRAQVERTTLLDRSRPAAMWARFPTLLLLERPGEFVILEPLSPLEERFHYRVARCRTGDDRLDALLRGDTIEVQPGLMRVLAGAREIASFARDAFLWSHERLFHPEFWWEYLRCTEQTRAPAAAIPESAPEAVPAGAIDAAAEHRGRLRRVLQRTIDSLAGIPSRPLAGFLPTEVSDDAGLSGWGELVVELRREDERLRVFIQDRAVMPTAYCIEGDFALVYDSDAAPTTPEHRRVLERLLRAFAQQTGIGTWTARQ